MNTYINPRDCSPNLRTTIDQFNKEELQRIKDGNPSISWSNDQIHAMRNGNIPNGVKYSYKSAYDAVDPNTKYDHSRIKVISNHPAFQRSRAVAEAWIRERNLVREGRGTRDWTQEEQKEILETGKCKKYVGHHIEPVSKKHGKAGDYQNIQFLTRSEHYDAHKGNWKNDPKGLYDPESKTWIDQKNPTVKELSERYVPKDKNDSGEKESRRIR